MNRNQRSHTGLVAASSLTSVLFGIIVRGAIEAWDTLLSTNPSYADADKVRPMLTDARTKVVPLAATRTGR